MQTAFSAVMSCVLLLATCWASIAHGDEPADTKPAAAFAKWEKEIAALEGSDAKQSPPENGIVFVGSSSIRMWSLAKSFPDLPVINHGFGGSQLADSVYFAPRLVLPSKPRIVVLYAGDNDLASGKSPQQVAEDYRQFVAVVRKALPETRVVYIGIKPSLKRWHLIDKVREANQLIQQQVAEDEKQAFVDIDAPMLGEDGKPRQELFVSDGLHLSAEGYSLWTKLVLPTLK